MTSWDDADQANDNLLRQVERPEGCTCELDYAKDYTGRIQRIYWSLELTCHYHFPKTAVQLDRLYSCPKQEADA